MRKEFLLDLTLSENFVAPPECPSLTCPAVYCPSLQCAPPPPAHTVPGSFLLALAAAAAAAAAYVYFRRRRLPSPTVKLYTPPHRIPSTFASTTHADRLARNLPCLHLWSNPLYPSVSDWVLVDLDTGAILYPAVVDRSLLQFARPGACFLMLSSKGAKEYVRSQERGREVAEEWIEAAARGDKERERGGVQACVRIGGEGNAVMAVGTV